MTLATTSGPLLPVGDMQRSIIFMSTFFGKLGLAIPVMISPGQTQLALTPCLQYSIDIDFVIANTAPFDAE